MTVLSLSKIAEQIGAELQCRDAMRTPEITGIRQLETAGAGHLAFLSNPKYVSSLASTKATAVIVSPDMAPTCPVHCLVMDNPYLGFAKAAALFDQTPSVPRGVHASAVIADGVMVPETAAIGPHVVIEAGVRLGAEVQINAGCVVGANVTIGDSTVLKPSVSLYHGVTVGKRCILHSGCVIGSDGFGLANDQGRWVKIPQLGGVTIGNDVEIGANTTIDRGALEDTVVADGAKIDNQVQIAHNVKVGEHTAMAAQVGVAGSAKIGSHCILAGKVGVNGHTVMTNQVTVTAMTGVSHSIDTPGIYSASIPAQEVHQWRRTWGQVNRLAKLAKRIVRIEKQLDDKDQSK